jgi:hypothetical protein
VAGRIRSDLRQGALTGGDASHRHGRPR